MPSWEFAYFYLWLGTATNTKTAVNEAKQQIAELGKEGWEPVGEVTFSLATGAYTDSLREHRALMFKRPT